MIESYKNIWKWSTETEGKIDNYSPCLRLDCITVFYNIFFFSLISWCVFEYWDLTLIICNNMFIHYNKTNWTRYFIFTKFVLYFVWQSYFFLDQFSFIKPYSLSLILFPLKLKTILVMTYKKCKVEIGEITSIHLSNMFNYKNFIIAIWHLFSTAFFML